MQWLAFATLTVVAGAVFVFEARKRGREDRSAFAAAFSPRPLPIRDSGTPLERIVDLRSFRWESLAARAVTESFEVVFRTMERPATVTWIFGPDAARIIDGLGAAHVVFWRRYQSVAPEAKHVVFVEGVLSPQTIAMMEAFGVAVSSHRRVDAPRAEPMARRQAA